MTRGYLSEIFVSFQGEGLYAGRRHLFLRFAGCHLRCRYCDTPGSLERTTILRVHTANSSRDHANPVGVGDVLGLALPLLENAGAVDGVAVTGGEPLLQADFLAELLADARWPRPRLLETSGTQPDKLAAVLPVIDIVSMDVKLPSNSGEAPFWDAHERFLAASRGKVYIKLPIDRGTSVDEVERTGRLIRALAPKTPVFLQPIAGTDGRLDVTAEVLERLFTAMKSQIADVRVLPQGHKVLGIQ